MKCAVAWHCALVLLLFSAASDALAQETRNTIDGTGREVTIPADPQRVVALHDAVIALPLYELGVPLAGSFGQVKRRGGTWDIFGLEELFGISAREAGIENIYSGTSLDVEKIRALGPDLIVGSESDSGAISRMGSTAPVFLHLSYSRDSYGLDGSRRLARALGRDARLAELELDYAGRVAALRAALPPMQRKRTFAVATVFDQIYLLTGAGGILEALDDLGFQQPDWVVEAAKGGTRMPLSPEALPRLDVDLLILLPMHDDPRNAAIRDDMDRIAPGWHLLFDPKDIMFADMLTTMSVTFASAHASIDAIAAHYGIEPPPRK